MKRITGSNPLSISFQPSTVWISIKTTITYIIHWNLASSIIVKFYPISLRMLLVGINDIMLFLHSHRNSMPMSIDLACHLKNHLDPIIWTLKSLFKNRFIHPIRKVPTCLHKIVCQLQRFFFLRFLKRIRIYWHHFCHNFSNQQENTRCQNTSMIYWRSVLKFFFLLLLQNYTYI